MMTSNVLRGHKYSIVKLPMGNDKPPDNMEDDGLGESESIVLFWAIRALASATWLSTMSGLGDIKMLSRGLPVNRPSRFPGDQECAFDT